MAQPDSSNLRSSDIAALERKIKLSSAAAIIIIIIALNALFSAEDLECSTIGAANRVISSDNIEHCETIEDVIELLQSVYPELESELSLMNFEESFNSNIAGLEVSWDKDNRNLIIDGEEIDLTDLFMDDSDLDLDSVRYGLRAKVYRRLLNKLAEVGLEMAPDWNEKIVIKQAEEVKEEA